MRGVALFVVGVYAGLFQLLGPVFAMYSTRIYVVSAIRPRVVMFVIRIYVGFFTE